MIWANPQLSGMFSTVTGNSSGAMVLVPHYTASSVTLVAEPVLLPAFATNTLSFSFQTVAGRTNLVQYTISLSPANWHTVETIAGDGTMKTFTGPPATGAMGFYRLVYQ
jgi:hypothetical protein